jgi:uncharacterized membrane protein
MDISLINHIFGTGLSVIAENADWMGWNLFLAIVPLALSVVLFRPTSLSKINLRLFPAALNQRLRSLPWWLTALVFIAFLPNAPYILTDVIHFFSLDEKYDSLLISTFMLVPLFTLFLLAGFGAYVISLINLGAYLNQIGLRRYVFTVEIVIHALNAVGVYLGRFLRFNSWDLVTNLPGVAMSIPNELLNHRPMLVMTVTFIVIAGLYVPFKYLVLAISAYGRGDRRQLAESNG